MYLNYAEAGEYAGCSASYLRKRVAAGDLPCIRLGRRVLLAKPDLDAFMAAHKVSA